MGRCDCCTSPATAVPAGRPARRAVRSARAGLLATTALVAATLGAHAQVHWQGANSTDWQDGGNWLGGVAPAAGEIVRIDTTLPNPTVLDGGVTPFLQQVTVGFGDDGLLTVNGGILQNIVSSVGLLAGSTGTVRVSGANSQWVNTGALGIGNLGAGVLTIEDGASVSAGNATIGDSTGGTGAVLVDGTGSSLSTTLGLANHIFVGINGFGSLTVSNGGTVFSGDGGRVGLQEDGVGHVTITGAGSGWTMVGSLSVGSLGFGRVTVADGASLNTALAANLGQGGRGEVDITGAGSRWDVVGTLVVGGSGEGTLAITDGGVVETGFGVFVGDGVLGGVAAGIGTATVSGTGSSWTMSDTLFIGAGGRGTLLVADGGVVESQTGGIIGDAATGIGSALVTGAGSRWDSLGHIHVGNEGFGELNIVDAAHATAALNGSIGRMAGGIGAVGISGPGSLWAVTGDLAVGGAGTGVLTVAGGGAISVGGTFRIAEDAGSAGTLNIGAAPGDEPVAPGILGFAEVVFGDGDGRVVLNHSADDYELSTDLSGSGRLDVLSGGTVLTGSGAAFSGQTSVTGSGALRVDSTLGGILDVSGGGLLSGTGSVGTTVLGPGGTISPGNSIGTLFITGDYTHQPGAVYRVEIDADGNADLIDVTGTATLEGGTVAVVPLGGVLLNHPYRILTTAGGVTGTFDELAYPPMSLYIGPLLTYTASDVFLTMGRVLDFCLTGMTFNQCSTAGGVQSLDPEHQVYNAILVLATEAEARQAFDALSGEIHAGIAGALLDDSRFPRHAAINRLRSASGGVASAPTPVMSFGQDGFALAPPATAGFAVWGEAFGAWGTARGDGNAERFRSSTGGIFIGGDAAVGADWRAGLFAGYSRSSFDLARRASSGSADSYHLGAYAGTTAGALALRAGAAHGEHRIAAGRSISFTRFADSARSTYRAGTTQFFAEAGYRIDTPTAAFEPFATLAYVGIRRDAFVEKGGPAALAGSSMSDDIGFSTLGLRAETELAGWSDEVRTSVRGGIGWRHAFADRMPTSLHRFAGGAGFPVRGIPLARHAVAVEAALDISLAPSASVAVAYDGQFAAGVSGHAVRGELRASF